MGNIKMVEAAYEDLRKAGWDFLRADYLYRVAQFKQATHASGGITDASMRRVYRQYALHKLRLGVLCRPQG